MNTRTITEELAQRGDIFYSLSMGDMAGTNYFAVPVHEVEVIDTPEWLSHYLTSSLTTGKGDHAVVDLLAVDDYIMHAKVGEYGAIQLQVCRLIPQQESGAWVTCVKICEDAGMDLDRIIDLSTL